MDLSDRVLGSSVTKKIRERAEAPLLRLGRDVFYRATFAGVDCFNFQAAANLSAILHTHLDVKDTADVFNRIAPSALALPRLGAVAIAVLGAAFEAKGLGGDAPLENWVKRHTEKGAAIVTFDSLKHRDEAATERASRKRRKHARRNQAHGVRVDRFTRHHEAQV